MATKRFPLQKETYISIDYTAEMLRDTCCTKACFLKVNLLYVPSKPNGGKMTPSQLADYMVTSIKQVTYLDMMVSTYQTRENVH